jgi:DNA repair ATPase RecN
MGNFIVQIKNFQSLSKVDLVLEDGLNIIVGKTNAGKSATLRAIDNAIFNTGDDDKVKAGQRFSGVAINNEKNKFFWKRDGHGKNEKTIYQINDGNAITKVGRTQLPEITSLFNITDVRLANGNKERINFWYQGEAPFLMKKTSGQLFEFLSQSSCEKYIKVIKTLELDMKTQKSKVESINATIDAYRTINKEKKELLTRNKGFGTLYKKIVVLNNDVSIFNKIEELTVKSTSMIARIKIKTKELSEITHHIKNIKFDDVKTSYEEISSLVDSVSRIKDLLENIKSKKESKKKANATLNMINNSLTIAKSTEHRCSVLVKYLDELDNHISNIKTVFEGIESKKKKGSYLLTTLKNVTLKINNVDLKSFEDEIKQLERLELDSKEVKILIDSYVSKENKRVVKENLLNQTSLEYNQAAEDFLNFKNEIGYCPYCESEIKSSS